MAVQEEQTWGEENSPSRCLICGASLQYSPTVREVECALCGRNFKARACCTEGHFVCGQCPGGDYLHFLYSFTARCESTDPGEVFLRLRDSYPFPMHGPEYHVLVPAAFLTAYHNLHGYPDGASISAAIATAAALPDGSCAFWGACSAALGIGIAYGTILQATPLSGEERGRVQKAVARILDRIAAFKAPRCCRRESLVSLQLACEMSAEMLPDRLATDYNLTCDQTWANQDCSGEDCPFFGA